MEHSFVYTGLLGDKISHGQSLGGLWCSRAHRSFACARDGILLCVDLRRCAYRWRRCVFASWQSHRDGFDLRVLAHRSTHIPAPPPSLPRKSRWTRYKGSSFNCDCAAAIRANTCRPSLVVYCSWWGWRCGSGRPLAEECEHCCS